MKIIGLTGGIGSGKTTVAKMFKKLGVPIYIADDRAKYILAHDKNAVRQVKELLGEQAYQLQENKQVPNRAYIAQQVFNNPEKLQQLNAIIHPKVRQDFEEFIENQQYPYIIYEAAILFESGGDTRCDQVILVTAPSELRINRVRSRDNVSEKQVVDRMNNQWSQLSKLNKSNLVIPNLELVKTNLYVQYMHDFLLNN